MASLIYDRALELFARGSIDFDTDTFKVMLTTSAYTEDKAAHDFRNDVTNEVSTTVQITAGAATGGAVAAGATLPAAVALIAGSATGTSGSATAPGVVLSPPAVPRTFTIPRA